MEGIALAARLLLALVFAAAGIGKLLDQPGARRALAGFGVSERLLVPTAVVLPVVELITAVALVARPSARFGAIAALCLLVLFVAAIARAMSRGEAPDCHCFGQLSSAPAGRRTLIRNTVLAAPAVLLVAYGPGEGVDRWVSGRSAPEIAAVGAGVCAAGLAALVIRLWIENRRLRRDLARDRQTLALLPPGLPVGAQAPRFTLPDADGRPVSLDELLAQGRPVALVFLSPSCSPCTDMLSDLARWQATLAERITIALLSTGTVRENRHLSEQHGLVNVLVQNDSEVFESYRTPATPSVVIVTVDGRIGTRIRSSRAIVETLIRRGLRDDVILPQGSSAANGDG
jgi:peroxiredoxin/uncharacterized membrane protein YphA (DoxX/SURF4 family)